MRISAAIRCSSSPGMGLKRGRESPFSAAPVLHYTEYALSDMALVGCEISKRTNSDPLMPYSS